MADSSAEEDYPDLAEQVEGLREQAAVVESRIMARKASEDGIPRQVADLWERHSGRKDWPKRAEKARGEARKLAEAGSFAEACVASKEAVAEFRKLVKWPENARKALTMVAESRAILQDKMPAPADRSPSLAGWSEALLGRIEEALLRDGGEDGPAIARRIAERLPQVEALLLKRRSVVELVRESQGGERLDGLGPRYREAIARLSEADETLVTDRFDDADRLYASGESEYRALASELNRYLQGLLENARAEVAAGKFAEANRRYQEYRRIRPDDPQMADIQRSAAIAERVARIRRLDRDAASMELAGLRRDQADSSEVRAIVDEFAARFEASGKRNLAAKLFDEARKDFQALGRLRPGDVMVDRLLASVVAQKKLDVEQAEVRKRRQEQAEYEQALAEQRAKDRRRQQAAESEAQARAAAKRPQKTQTFGAAGVPAQGGGIFVLQSNPGTPASKLHGGLEYGDVILTINGRAVNTENAYWEAVRNSPDYMKLTYRNVRNGAVYDVGIWLDR